MAKLPQKVKIGPTHYSINYMSKDQDEAGVYGRCNTKTHEIHINRSICDEEAKASVLHEVLHGVFSVANVSHVLNMNEQGEENLIRMLEPFMLQLIRENPKLMEYLKNVG